MGVSFCSCDCCGDSRYSEFVGECSKCNHSLCTSCVINDDIESQYAHHYGIKFDNSPEQKEEYGITSKDEDEYGYNVGEIIEDVGMDSKYCPFCNGNKVSDDDLLNYLLHKFKIDKEELKQEYLNTL